MTKPFYREPILNSPYAAPTRHHALSDDGEPLDHPPIEGRRPSRYIVPVPKARRSKGKGASQPSLALDGGDDSGPAYSVANIVNEIRKHLESWRAIPNPNDWGVTPATQRLLQHWRSHAFQGPKPFFCQIEAVETAIWLTEVARGRRQYEHIFRHLKEANDSSNPELYRLALKLATGAGKTTVMAMLIAWQAVNAVRQPNSSLFSRGFLLIAPGITIKDRLRVLNPSDTQNYYDTRELVPADLRGDLGKAKIVITNYHAFQRRKAHDLNAVGERLMQGRTGQPIERLETEGEMLQRACGELLPLKNIVVLNDEAHHCYRERPPTEDELAAKGDEKDEAEKNREAARLWISGIEALKRKVGLRSVYDLSATPFFLRGSGYVEGTLFPWVVSDFSLVDAIECGIVKLPRVPVADNSVNSDDPIFRKLWENVGPDMPKKGKGKAGELDPTQLPAKLQTALKALYGHYEQEFDDWESAGFRTPPVFIVVCNNTASSNLVYEWIAGWQRGEGDERRTEHLGNLKLFSNFDQYGNPLPRMRTLLIDSEQIDSGEALDDNFRKLAANEIEIFRREKIARDGAAADNITDAELLREVMNTVGREGRLGEQIRCVVSVSMLTEGWDANTVTHILGVRAFGTQLLCEQVVGRGLRRQSYEADPATGLFDTEYADILGIPFDFATERQNFPKKPPKPVTRVHAVREREALSIRYPRVAGYRAELPDDRLSATFSADSRLELTPELVGPSRTRLEGLVGEGHDISPPDDMRAGEVATRLSKLLAERYLRKDGENPPYHLFGKIQPITRRWLKKCLVLKGAGMTIGMVCYDEIASRAAALIYNAMVLEAGAAGKPAIKALLDPYNSAGSTDHVSFITAKTNLWKTAADKSHINYVVCDSDWEAEFARVVEAHPQTLSYAKNQGLGLEIPYLDGSTPRRYLPDFVVRLDDGRDDPLNIVVEIKGQKDLLSQLKSETARAFWVPGVNNLGTFGRWSFVELSDAFAIEDEWAKLVAGLARTLAPAETM